jgi:hypothetical protein
MRRREVRHDVGLVAAALALAACGGSSGATLDEDDVTHILRLLDERAAQAK